MDSDSTKTPFISQYGAASKNLREHQSANNIGAIADNLILPLLHGHPDKRFNIAIRGETDGQEEVRDEGRA